jgi:hypothetical protein
MSNMGQWLINFRIMSERQLLFEAWLNMIHKTYDQVTYRSYSEEQFKNFNNDGTHKHMFVTMYTDKGDKINIVNFTYKDLEKSYKDALKSTRYDVYFCNNDA